MTIEEGLQSFLTTDPTISATIGTRCYPIRVPPGVTYPAITYQRIAGNAVRSHDGASSLFRSRIQLKAWGETYAAARNLGNALRTLLDGYVGAMSSKTVSNSIIELDLDYEDPTTDLYFAVVDVTLWHN